MTDDFSVGLYEEWRDWSDDAPLRTLVGSCIELQRRVCREWIAGYRPDPARARAAVEPAALEALLTSGRDVHGISSERDITDALAVNAAHIEGTVLDRQVARLRRKLDRAVRRRLERRLGGRPRVVNSGHFWYPPGSYMGWHTNQRAPGLRLYLTVVETPGKSFFRYRDPVSGSIETSWDRGFDVRLFRVGSEPLWHAIYSETDRFSFGFLVKPWSLSEVLRHRAHQLRRRIRPARSRSAR